MRTRLTAAAHRQRDALLLESAVSHGVEAADRYDRLLQAAVQAIGEDPARPGSTAVPHIPGVRLYPLRLSRHQLAPRLRVTSPRHVVIYRTAPENVVEIIAIVHDRMLLARAARRAIREADRE